MPTPVIAIFDIGKTNKKVFLLDETYSICFEKSTQLPETKDEDGFPCEDIHLLSEWVQSSFRDLLRWHEFTIKALNVSAHGATLVHLDKMGKPVTPLYNYLKTYPDHLRNQFYKKYGGEREFARNTASPVLGHLNSGMQLYWLKQERPLVFNNIAQSLHLPEYISYLFTGTPASGITSIGCHTNLWDFANKTYHAWVEQEGIAEKLAPLQSSTCAVRYSVEGTDIAIGIGLHDSSAALIPYLVSFADPFVLISTGTWNISLNPFNPSPLTDEELINDCLCYLTYEGKPVKASRFFAGHYHECETRRIANHFRVADDFYKTIHVESEQIPPIPAKGEGYEDPANYSSYEDAYLHFMIQLVQQQANSTQRIITNTPVKRMFVDGGFSQNSIFMHLLARSFPDLQVMAASVAQASALGAAMAIHDYWNTKNSPPTLVQLCNYSRR